MVVEAKWKVGRGWAAGTRNQFDEDEKTESWPFHEVVGGLMWLAFSTCPN